MAFFGEGKLFSKKIFLPGLLQLAHFRSTPLLSAGKLQLTSERRDMSFGGLDERPKGCTSFIPNKIQRKKPSVNR